MSGRENRADMIAPPPRTCKYYTYFDPRRTVRAETAENHCRHKSRLDVEDTSCPASPCRLPTPRPTPGPVPETVNARTNGPRTKINAFLRRPVDLKPVRVGCRPRGFASPNGVFVRSTETQNDVSDGTADRLERKEIFIFSNRTFG